MTVTAGEGHPLGPGELKIGATGTEIDVSCLVNNAVIAMSKDQDDPVTKLCGTVVQGAVTYTYALSGNIDLDVAEATGLFALSQGSPGSTQDFSYTPNTEVGTKAVGKLVLDPLDFGGDEVGQTMAADFEWALVGAPTYTYGGATAEAAPADEETAA